MLISDRLVVDIGLLAVLRRDYSVLPVEVVEYPGEKRQAPGEVDGDIHKLLDRSVQPVDESHRGSDHTDCEARIDIPYNEPATGKVNEKRTHLREHAHDDSEHLARSLLLEIEVGHFLVDLNEILVFLLFAGEYLYEHRAAYRQCLVYLLVELIALGLALSKVFPACTPRRSGREHQKRYYSDADDREWHRHAEQRDQCGDHGSEVAHDIRQCAADNGAYTAYVRIHSRNDIALLLCREEGMRHVLEMLIHLVAHVEDDLLGYPRVYVVLKHSYKLAHGKSRERRQKQLDKKIHVLADQGFVHDAPRYDRRQKPHSGRKQYRDEHENELQPVWLQVTQDPHEQFSSHFRLVLLLFLSQEAHRPHSTRSWSCHKCLPFKNGAANMARRDSDVS